MLCANYVTGCPICTSHRQCDATALRNVLWAAYLDAELLARLLDHFGEGWVVDVADFVEQVMLDLEIQPAEEPAKTVPAGKVHRGLDLVYRPLRRSIVPSPGHGDREVGLVHAMGQLEDHAQHNAADEGGER